MKHHLLAFAASLALVLAGCGEGGGAQTKTADGEQTPAAQTSGEDANSKTVAVVNGVSIPESRIEFYAPSQQAAANLQGPQRLAVIENMINSELISQQARKAGVAEQVRQQLVVAEQTVLGRAYVTKFLEDNPVSDADIDKVYDDLRKEFEGRNEYRTAHILVDDEDKAKELLAQIKEAPDSFADLARDNSKDTGSAQNGGDLDWVSPANLVRPFAEAMEKTAKGEVHPEAVQTQFGWHIIRVDDIRPTQVPAMDDQMRAQLRQQAQAEKITAHLQALAEQAQIERPEGEPPTQ